MMSKINGKILFYLYETNQITEEHLKEHLLDETGNLDLKIIDKGIYVKNPTRVIK